MHKLNQTDCDQASSSVKRQASGRDMNQAYSTRYWVTYRSQEITQGEHVYR